MNSKVWQIVSVFITVITYTYIAYFLERSNFMPFILCMALLFFLMLLTWKLKPSIKFIQWVGLLFRLIFLFSLPALSDDFYRFLWDGALSLNGINPFGMLPSEVVIDFNLKEELLVKMNSPNYYSIYPPFSQLIYIFGALGINTSLNYSIILLRLPLFLAEVALIMLIPRLLKRLKINPLNCIFYILNPLVVVEVLGNLHFEGMVVLFLATAIYLFNKDKWVLASLALGMACSTKLTPLILLPLFFVKFPVKHAVKISAITLLSFVLSWWPFYGPNTVLHFLESFRLYFQSFEFNASIYYLLREFGYSIYGYNIIQSLGKILPVVSITIMMLIMWGKRNITWSVFLFKAMLLFIVYYAFASIVHPWYVILPLFFSIFTNFKSIVLWSFLILFSYSAYHFQSVEENYILIGAEYLMFGGLLFWELLNHKPASVTPASNP